MPKLDYVILDLLESSARNLKAHPLNLGGIAGGGGGVGGPPGGFIGWLPQTRVAYDEDELETPATAISGMSLLDNLNHIRYRLGTLESGGSILIVDDDVPASYLDVDTIHFSGTGVIVTDLGNGDVRVTINATGSGGGIEEAPIDGNPYSRQDAGWVLASGSTGTPLTVQEQDGAPIVTNVDKIIFSGALVTDLGSGDVLVAITATGSGGAALVVQEVDGSPSISNVDKIIFSGATITDLGSGDVLVSVASSGGGIAIKSMWSADATPESTTTQDDEFADASVDGKWTEIDHDSILAVSEETQYPHMKFTATNRAGRNVCGLAQSIPAGDFTITCKVRMATNGVNYSYAGLALWEGTGATDNIYLFCIHQRTNEMHVTLHSMADRNTYTTALFTWNINAGAAKPGYLRIRRNSTNYYYGVSSDGTDWQEGSSAYNPAFTPTHFGIAVDNQGTGADVVARFSFFRYIASDVGRYALLTGRKVNIYA